MCLIGIPPGIHIVFRVGPGRQVVQQFLRNPIGVFVHFAVLMDISQVGGGIDLGVDGRAPFVDHIAPVGGHLTIGGDIVAGAHIHHVDGTQTGDGHLQRYAGRRAEGTGVGQHILIPHQLPVEVRLGGGGFRHGQLQIALKHAEIHLTCAVFINGTGGPHLRRDADGHIAWRIVVLTGELRLNAVDHPQFAVIGGGQIQMGLVIQLRLGHRLTLGGEGAVRRDPFQIDTFDLGAVQLVGAASLRRLRCFRSRSRQHKKACRHQ